MGSTGSNVSPGNVFVDENPAASPAERFKMNARITSPRDRADCSDPSCKLEHGMHVWTSADGFAFSHLSGPHVPFSDTQSVIFFSLELSKYLVYFRTHKPRPDRAECPFGGRAERSIGRLAVADLGAADWGPGDLNQTSNASTVFNVDDEDPVCLDVYTSAAVGVAGHVFIFPMMYMHCSLNASKSDRFACARLANGKANSNNGLLEAQMAVADSRGESFTRISRDAYLPSILALK